MAVKVENCDPNSSTPVIVDYMDDNTGNTTPLQTHVLRFGEFILVDWAQFRNLRVTRST